ncbi:MAG: tetraacyldisaccharide 4'-kinase [Xanthomonadales bacterium]|nr:tetraacyldisaccharide 4'-kinase [Xanthomonadales bacterium]
MTRGLQHWLEARWYGNAPVPWWLAGLERLFAWLAARDRRRQRARQVRLPVPVIVIGNIGVGGSGKTPLVIALIEHLRQAGWRPGVVSRGYGRRGKGIHRVAPADAVEHAGDEPVLIARRTGAPVVVAADRVAAGRTLVATGEIDIVLADDGLQHLALARDVEIVVIDGRRRLGNARLLPAGPLREAPQRLRQVDLVLVNGPRQDGEPGFDLVMDQARSLGDDTPRPLREFQSGPVHAVAGIGDPARFFTALRQAGLTLIEHPFPDHHRLQPDDLDFPDRQPVLMTEKDAVKCRDFAQPHWFHVPVNATLDARALASVAELLARLPERDAALR